MAQYIDKDALVAEIEKWINGWTERLNNTNPLNPSFFEGGIAVGKHILSFIDTLEVKEVDLEKEINKYICDNFFGSQTLGFFANRTKEEPDDQDIALCAKHFFELGMQVSSKAQKGEEV